MADSCRFNASCISWECWLVPPGK